VIWSGPTVPVLGQLDITREELHNGLFQGLRLTAVALAFAAYALLLDHDRLVQAAGFARRSVLTIGARDAARADARARRLGPRRVAARARAGGARRARPCAPARPLLAGSLERALNLARRWRRAATGSPARRGRRVRAGPLSTGSHWSRPDAVAMGALWL
jgi:hypothetical protein